MLSLQGCNVTQNGLTFEGDLTEARWHEAGHALALINKTLMWWIGDWLLAGETAGYLERGKYEHACEQFNIAYNTALQAVRVSKAFPQSCIRIQDLTWGHHQIVANRADGPELLEWASANQATIRELTAEKQRRDRLASPTASSASGHIGGVQWSFGVGDCRNLALADDSVDLVFCSPPYESQRTYEHIGFNLTGDEYVAWAADCFMECLRVSRGLVAWVVEGVTEDFAYSYTPFLLGAELQRRGAKLRKPVVYQRNGIPGTGGPDWLRNDWEPVICATKCGRLPWSNNTAMGSSPKYNKPRQATNRNKDGTRKSNTYIDPEICNPGNVIKGTVGKGHLGWEDSHHNEAPFPEWLAEFFVKSFCQPGGTVLDPFSGSGTTVAAAVKNGRNGIGLDIRENQVWLGETRLLGLRVTERRSGQGVLI